jgi:REP element-mobilizing transposase RayT
VKRKEKQARQLSLFRHGGARKGAGRKPKGRRALLPRDARPEIAARYPVQVTVKVERGLPSLRTPAAFRLLVSAFAECGWRPSFRVVHFSVQDDHVHLLCEVTDRVALSNGMKGLGVRIARGLNRLWGRRGPVLKDRFHAHILKTPQEAHHSLFYVLANGRKHGHSFSGLDPYSSAATFPGWKKGTVSFAPRTPLALPRTWLLSEGWRHHGLLDPTATPGPRPKRRANATRRPRARAIKAATPADSAKPVASQTPRNQVSARCDERG